MVCPVLGVAVAHLCDHRAKTCQNRFLAVPASCLGSVSARGFRLMGVNRGWKNRFALRGEGGPFWETGELGQSKGCNGLGRGLYGRARFRPIYRNIGVTMRTRWEKGCLQPTMRTTSWRQHHPPASHKTSFWISLRFHGLSIKNRLKRCSTYRRSRHNSSLRGTNRLRCCSKAVWK